MFGIKCEARDKLVSLLREFYPAVVDFKVKQERAGWKKLSIIEEFEGERIDTDSKHVNDGLLRILAIIAQLSHGNSLLLFDAVENGVNPEIVEQLVEVLRSSGQQVLVTNHSPMILNYLPDDIAKAAVRFIYRTYDGSTRVRALFSVPGEGLKIKPTDSQSISAVLTARRAK